MVIPADTLQKPVETGKWDGKMTKPRLFHTYQGVSMSKTHFSDKDNMGRFKSHLNVITKLYL
jgi:hypothetical protein